MAKIIKENGSNGAVFDCPGCGMHHAVNLGDTNSPMWSWNGDVERPTFSPSVLARHTKMTEVGEKQYAEWREQGFPPRLEQFDHIDVICHSFVADGRIQFLGDCTHKLAGQTVDLPDVGVIHD